MIRLLVFSPFPMFGGPHNQALRLAEPLRARGFDTTVLLPEAQGNAVERLRAAGLRVLTRPLQRPRATLNLRVQGRWLRAFVRDVHAISTVIEQERIDVVQLTGLTSLQGALAGRRCGRPVVWQLLDTRTPWFIRAALSPVIRHFSTVVMTTGLEVARVHPRIGVLGHRLVPFFPPVDTDMFAPSAEVRRKARETLGVPENEPIVGVVGNLNPQKGHEYVIQAAAIARRRHPSLKVRILGATTPTHLRYEEALRNEAGAQGFELGVSLELLDPADRVHELVQALDVFVLGAVPRSEGVPTAILEAMACGVPVVATDVGGVREVVEDGATGFVVEPERPDLLAAALIRLLDDAGKRLHMGREARRRAVTLYDSERSADAHELAYRRALAIHLQDGTAHR